MKGSKRAQFELLLATVLVLFVVVRGATVTYDWTVDYAYQSPDCVEKLIISINGQYPGPLVRATVGDTVVVNVVNQIPSEGITIHWHGILQKGTPWADGASYVSQCPINPGEYYSYSFTVTQAGTFFYHGHNGMQRSAGFYGSIIVDLPAGTKEPFSYDGELHVLLNDWWHQSHYQQELGLDSVPFRFVGEPQSLLIEGRGSYNCSLVPTGAVPNSGDCVTCNSSNPQCAPFVLPVVAGKTYRLRITSAASLSALNFILEGHNMTVVEASAHYVEPIVVQNLDVYSGESYSVLFTANQDSSRNYWAAINVRGRLPETPTGLAVLNYVNNPSTSLPTTPHPVSPIWNDFDLSLANAQAFKARDGYVEQVPKTPTRQIYLLNTQNTLNKHLKWAINNITYVPTSAPVLGLVKHKLFDELLPVPADSFPASYNISAPPPYTETRTGSGVYIFNFGDVVDIILQNANTLTVNNSEIHPWHLHGHDFWVLGFGKGEFNPNTDYAKLNYVNAPKMSTAPVFPYAWTVLRFVADNPGAWPFHCHVESHYHMGMGVVFAEGLQRLPDIPRENLGCGIFK